MLCAAFAMPAAGASSSLLLPPWMAAFEIEVDAQASAIEWAGATARDVALRAHLRDGVLELEARSPDLAGGTARGTFTHSPAAETRLTLMLRDVDAGAFAPLRPYVRAMPSDVAVELHAQGARWDTLVATASGHAWLAHAGGGVIEKTFERAGASLIGSLLGKVLGAFRPFRDASETTVMECLRFSAPVARGRIYAPRLLELWTPRMRVSGGGSIDLVDGVLDIALTPAPRQGIRIGGLDAVHTIDVAGTLAAPRVHVDSGRLLERAADLGAVVATVGGRAVIDTLNSRRAAQGEPCGAIVPP